MDITTETSVSLSFAKGENLVTVRVTHAKSNDVLDNSAIKTFGAALKTAAGYDALKAATVVEKVSYPRNLE